MVRSPSFAFAIWAGVAALNELNARLLDALEGDGRVFITGTQLNGQHVIRACIINHRMVREDIDFLLQTIRDVAAQVELSG